MFPNVYYLTPFNYALRSYSLGHSFKQILDKKQACKSFLKKKKFGYAFSSSQQLLKCSNSRSDGQIKAFLLHFFTFSFTEKN